MNATMRFIVWGTIPIGAIVGGFLGGAIGLHPTIWVGAIGGALRVPAGAALAGPLDRRRCRSRSRKGPGATRPASDLMRVLPTEAAESGVVAGRAPYVEVPEDPS